MLRVWKMAQPRPTMDIDLLGRTSNETERIAEIMRGACAQGVDSDGLQFDSASVVAQPIAQDSKYAGVRITFRGNGCARGHSCILTGVWKQR